MLKQILAQRVKNYDDLVRGKDCTPSKKFKKAFRIWLSLRDYVVNISGESANATSAVTMADWISRHLQKLEISPKIEFPPEFSCTFKIFTIFFADFSKLVSIQEFQLFYGSAYLIKDVDPQKSDYTKFIPDKWQFQLMRCIDLNQRCMVRERFFFFFP